jgi:ABC-type branched-subunit amino acid transport system substrate-binding protein
MRLWRFAGKAKEPTIPPARDWARFAQGVGEVDKKPGSDHAGARYHLGSDTAALLVAAIKNANSTAPEDVLDALSKIRNFQGVTGTISFDGSRIPSKPVTILEVADGRRRFVEQIVPATVPSP